jgi:glyoxylate reductase
MKPRVLVTRKLLPEALVYLREHAEVEGGESVQGLSRQELKDRIRDKDGLLCLLVDRIDSEVIQAAPRLRMIANCAVGVDNIDLEAARRRGVLVSNTPGMLTEATADLTWGLILAAARQIPQADRFTREGRFRGWELDLFLGKDISGRRLGIIGMGRIGRAVARRALGFGMEIVYHEPRRLPVEDESDLRAAWLPLDELLRTADVVTVHASLTEESRHLLSADKLRLMKKDAILVNVSRGPIVDEGALAEALERRLIWAAGLDVYEREPEIAARLRSLDNIVLLPHIGSATLRTRLAMAMTAARNLIEGLRGGRPENLVGED